MEGIPVLDFEDWRSGTEAARSRFVDGLGRGLSDIGFVVLTRHGIDRDTVEEAYAQGRRFFALSEAAKTAYEVPSEGRQRGYTSFRVEHARDSKVADLKEFWQTGPLLDAAHPLVTSGRMPLNHYPTEVPGFGPALDRVYEAFSGFAAELLEAVGIYLGVERGFFRDVVRDGNSVVRLIHYPPVEGAEPGAVRSAAHEDINLLTVLPASTQPGLELQDRDGNWMPVFTPPDVMICDTGDIMKRLTGGMLRATTHRVVNPPGSENVARFSMPFFLHPRPDYLIRPLRGDEPPVLAEDFLAERLRDIGVL